MFYEDCWDGDMLLRSYVEYCPIAFANEDEEDTSLEAIHNLRGQRIVFEDGDKQVLGQRDVNIRCYSTGG